MPNARILGAYIRQRMKEKNLSVSAVASMLSCSEVDVQRLLCGRALASYPQMQRLAEGLGLSVPALLRNASGIETNASREKILDIIWDYMDVRDAVLC